MKESSVEFLKSQFIQNGKLTVADFQQAKEMESQKDAKYNEMLKMLERFLEITNTFNHPKIDHLRGSSKQLIKEATQI